MPDFDPDLKIFFGVIKAFVPQTIATNKLPDNADVTVPVVIQYYTVRGPDRQDYKVRQLQIDPQDRIPYETVALCIFNPFSNEYEMQVPVWLADPVTGVT